MTSMFVTKNLEISKPQRMHVGLQTPNEQNLSLLFEGRKPEAHLDHEP